MKIIVFIGALFFMLPIDASMFKNSIERQHYYEFITWAYSTNVKRKSDNQNRLQFRSGSFQTCLFGVKPKAVMSNSISSFFSLVIDNLEVTPTKEKYSLPVFVDNVENCPENTEMYLLIYDKNYSTFKLTDLRDKVLEINGLEKVNYFQKRSTGTVNFFHNTEKFITFITVNQISLDKEYKSTEDKINARTVVEELYQAFFFGRDFIILNEKPFSILHEPKGLQASEIRNTVVDLKKGDHLNYYSSGLCSYDIWHLLFQYGIGMEADVMTEYEESFNEKFNSIIEVTNSISRNKKYQNIIDPRCSLNNTGPFSHIPVWR